METPKALESFLRAHSEGPISAPKRLGGGYYADVYLVQCGKDGQTVLKAYKQAGVMQAEITQLGILREHAAVPMPRVLWTHEADAELSFDVLAMDFLPGTNGGAVRYFSRKKRERLAEQVVDILLHFHQTESPDGFGEIGSNARYATFQDYYKPRAASILEAASKLDMPEAVFATAKAAFEQFDSLFYLPIERASLIHGDYNMWNILVDKTACKVTAVIDPCNGCWADSEMDLYQLNNANGRQFRLLEIYAKKKPLTANFAQKNAFYELFTELEHYARSGVPVSAKRVTGQAKALKAFLR